MRTTNFVFLKVSLTILVVVASILNVSAQSTDSLPVHRKKSSDVMIGDKFSGPITKSELLNSEKLSLSDQVSSYFEIASFRLTRIRKGENPVEIDNDKNGEITNEMKELINASIAGDKLYFEYIKCKSKDGTKRSMGSISFIIE